VDAPAGAGPLEERREGGRDGEEARPYVRHLHPRQVALGKLGEKAGEGREVEVVADAPRVRPLRAEARERDDDEARVEGREALPAEVPALERAGPEALDEDVGVPDHLPEGGGPRERKTCDFRYSVAPSGFGSSNATSFANRIAISGLGA
jgi:hypothetical protein